MGLVERHEDRLVGRSCPFVLDDRGDSVRLPLATGEDHDLMTRLSLERFCGIPVWRNYRFEELLERRVM